jgi:hypothetical protein
VTQRFLHDERRFGHGDRLKLVMFVMHDAVLRKQKRHRGSASCGVIDERFHQCPSALRAARGRLDTQRADAADGHGVSIEHPGKRVPFRAREDAAAFDQRMRSLAARAPRRAHPRRVERAQCGAGERVVSRPPPALENTSKDVSFGGDEGRHENTHTLSRRHRCAMSETAQPTAAAVWHSSGMTSHEHPSSDTNRDLHKGATEEDRPGPERSSHPGLDQDGMPNDAIAIAQDRLGARDDQSQG